ncbi:MAG: GntR family transcriptional regulator [Peptococcaceae bacterium BICA1-7]|nr:MAG: GntR family transcriptional regulator [Peptococcaceae bacterium BICA1-7]HBV95839.1 GntR family transcriptional regulator [Desulfotomaculum sp.]
MELDVNSPLPLHVQLKDLLRSEILLGELQERIPSERELMDRFNVSRSTIRQAVSALVREGVLEKIHGKGTFISHRPVEEWLGNLSTYNNIIEEMGMKPSTRLLHHGVETMPREIANTLGVDDHFYLIERLRYADNVPIAIEKQYYPVQIGLKLAEFDLNTAVLYDLLELSLGIKLWEAEQIISSAQPTGEECNLLEIPADTSVMVFERITSDPEGTPVEFLRGVFRSDMYSFRIKLARRKG